MTRQKMRNGVAVLVLITSCSVVASDMQHLRATLEHIEVTAQKTRQPLQSVPVSVTALSSEWLTDTASLDIFDTTQFVPAFAAMQNQSATNSSFSIRGIGTTAQNFGFESSVGLYINGVYRSRQNALINDLVDIQRLEILRGPQGTLFGKNTPAGAVIVEYEKPEHGERNGFAELTLGNDNLLRVSAGGSYTLLDDVLTLRASGFSTQRDGFVVDAVSEQTLNDRNRSGGMIQLRYTPTEAIDIRIIGDYAELDERCCAALTWQDNRQATDMATKFGTDALLMQPPFNADLFTRADFFSHTTALSQPPRSTLIDKGLSVQLDYQIDLTWSLTSITAHRSLDSFDRIDTDFSNANLLVASNDAGHHTFSQELQWHYQHDALSGIIGLFYYTQNFDLTFGTRTQSHFPAFFAASASELQPLVQGIDTLSVLSRGLIAPAASAVPANTAFIHSAYQQHDSMAAFAHNAWRLSDRVTLTTGLRYTREEKELTAHFDEQGPGINGLTQNPEYWPAPVAAADALGQIAISLASGQAPTSASLSAIAPFQEPGWGYYFLGSAAVMPRPDLNEAVSDGQFTGTLKLSYQHPANTLIYGSVSNGYKAGGINTDRISPQFDAAFGAEKARTIELGIKRDWPELKLRTNLTLYTTHVTDFQATTFTGYGFNLQNAGSIDADGAELEVTWLPWQHTELRLAAARTLARFDHFEKGTCRIDSLWHTGIDDPGRASPGQPYCSRVGDRVGFEPENTLNVSAVRYFQIARLPATVSVDYHYVGDVMLDDTNDPLKSAPSYQLLNLRLQIRLPDWDTDITLWGRNIFDEEYVARSAFSVPVQTGKIMAYPGQPVSVGVSLRSRF